MAQNADDLILKLKKENNDTSKLTLLFSLTDQFEDEAEWVPYNKQAFELAEKLSTSGNTQIAITAKKAMAKALNNYGFLHFQKNNKEEALAYYNRSLKIQQSVNDQAGEAFTYNNIGGLYLDGTDIKAAKLYFEKSVAIFEKLGNSVDLTTSLGSLASAYEFEGDMENAIIYHKKSLAISEKINNKEGIGRALNNLGTIYDDRGDVKSSIDYFSKAIKISEETGNMRGLAYATNNIASVYSAHGDMTKALEFYNKSMLIQKRLGNGNAVANVLNNIANIYDRQHKPDLALAYFNKSLKMHEENGGLDGIARSMGNIGHIYMRSDVDKALVYYIKSLDIARSIQKKEIIAVRLNSIATAFIIKGKYKLAAAYCDSSLRLSKEMGIVRNIRDAEKNLSRIDSAFGNFKGAFEHYKIYITYRDSTANESVRKATIKNQLNYEFEKKEAIIKEEQEKERAIAEEKNRFQKIIIWSVVVGLLLVIFFAVFISRSLKTTRHQKHIIEEKQKEILDSIHYAKRIQTSLLPTEKYISKHLDKDN